MSPDQMWDDMNIPYTEAEVYAFNKELEEGTISVANSFKDFIIQNVKPKLQMRPTIDGETFDIECNKYFNIGETTNHFDLYDTFSNSIKRISNTTTVKRPDLISFKRFFVTEIIHNLDSQVENNTTDAVYDSYGWVIDIHDALVLDCEAVQYAQDVFCAGRNSNEPSLNRIYKERNNILSKYFTSIGIGASAMKAWKDDVVSKVIPYNKPFNCNRIVLK